MSLKFKKQGLRYWSGLLIGWSALLWSASSQVVEADTVNLGGATHIGTFEGQTTFATSSENGVNPGLFIEVMDRYGKLTQYESEEGVITIDGTEEGAYVTQAKLLGKTMYRDVDTNELLENWEAGRNLALESAKMPLLKTVGKNLFDEDINVGFGIRSDTGEPYKVSSHSHTNYIPVKPNTQYTITQAHTASWVFAYDANKQYLSIIRSNLTSGTTITTPKNARYIILDADTNDTTVLKNGLQIEQGSTPTSYEPYKSNILTTNEEVELRGIGEARDELNLLTGELTERIGEFTFDGTNSEDDYIDNTGLTNITRYRFQKTGLNFKYHRGETNGKTIYNSDILPGIRAPWENNTEEGFHGDMTDSKWCWIHISNSRLSSATVEGVKAYFKQNPITVQYEFVESTVKTVVLTNTYTFGHVATRDVYVQGKVLPLIASVRVPTETLSFVLNPNEEGEQAFIAPEFQIMNETPASIFLELRQFEQVSTVFQDVLPTAHENWEALGREESKDFALALVPKASENWLSLEKEAVYVAEGSNVLLGEIKPKSAVDFSFQAKHGRAILEQLEPLYRLYFVFGF